MALANLFDHLLVHYAVAGGNPVHGVIRSKIENNDGETPALGDHQAKALLEAPDEPRSRVCAIEPFSPCCSTTACAAKRRRCCR